MANQMRRGNRDTQIRTARTTTFGGAHKHSPETWDLADGFWRFHGMQEPVQPELALEFNKHLINEGRGEDAFIIHKQVPYQQQSRHIEALTAPFHSRLPTTAPQGLKFPSELDPESLEDLNAMANYMSQLHYIPSDIAGRLEDERQKSARSMSGR